MHLPGIFAPFALSLSLALAAVVPAPKRFLLKTAVYPGEDMTKNGLYLGAYPINSGADDLVFRPRRYWVDPIALVLNGTLLQWDGAPGRVETAQMHIEGFDHGWAMVSLDVGYPAAGFVVTEGFYIGVNNTLTWKHKDWDFRGWLVCDWYHGVPQLFWKSWAFDERHILPTSEESEKEHVLPSTCASIDLVMEKYNG